MEKYFLGIDQSKRSTGCVLVDDEGDILDFQLICNSEDDNEELIYKQWVDLDSWLNEYLEPWEQLEGALIEGLAFGAKGAAKDFLAGLQWYFRTTFLREYGLFLGTVPVSMWRSKVLTKEEQRVAKQEGKDGLKKATFDKLDAKVQRAFLNYVQTLGFKKAAVYDLTDAYFIAQHCRKLIVYN